MKKPPRPNRRPFLPGVAARAIPTVGADRLVITVTVEKRAEQRQVDIQCSRTARGLEIAEALLGAAHELVGRADALAEHATQNPGAASNDEPPKPA